MISIDEYSQNLEGAIPHYGWGMAGKTVYSQAQYKGQNISVCYATVCTNPANFI